MRRILSTLAVALSVSSAAHAFDVYSPNGAAYTSASASSTFNGGYTPDNFFDENPIPGQEVSLGGSDINFAYGGSAGPGPHYVEFEIDSVQTIQSIFYANRDFNNTHNPTFDKVESISLWVSDTTAFTAANPGTAALQTFAIPASPDPRHDTDLFAEYTLNAPVSGRYFLISLSGKPSEAGVIGGRELRVGVPEPATGTLLLLPLFLCAKRRGNRARA
jgi:hypothetical protein